MSLSSIQKQINNLPETPGVYFFLGSPKRSGGGKDSREVLYIGKATSLRDRVKSYFSKDIEEARGPLIVQMMEKARKIEYEETGSVLEALLREAQLIKKYQPPYNTDLKDDKSHNYIVITKEGFPRVLLVRGKDLPVLYSPENRLYIIGPFPQEGILKSALKIIRKIFPFRDTCTPNVGKPCFNAQIGLCPGVCSGQIDKKGYRNVIKNLILFFEGKKSKVIRTYEKQMKIFAKEANYEAAQVIKKRLFSLQHIQDISLLKREEYKKGQGGENVFRIEAYDIAHLGGSEMVGVMTVIENGLAKKSDYRKFKIRGFKEANDLGALKEILARRLKHSEWPYPNLIVVDGNKIQQNVANDLIKENKLNIEIVSVVKDVRHHPRAVLGEPAVVEKYQRDILFANAEAHRFAINFHRFRRSKNFLK
ncbi:MAG: GIY-YIG nuclease family protein [Patescibacteria group bacterium]